MLPGMGLVNRDGSQTAKEEETMEAATSKTTKAKGKPKTAKKAKAVKEPKPKKEKAPKEPQVVFAFRLTKEQRDRIHKAAGPGKATRFVRTAAIAAANLDRAAFDQLLAEAKAHLKK